MHLVLNSFYRFIHITHFLSFSFIYFLKAQRQREKQLYFSSQMPVTIAGLLPKSLQQLELDQAIDSR